MSSIENEISKEAFLAKVNGYLKEIPLAKCKAAAPIMASDFSKDEFKYTTVLGLPFDDEELLKYPKLRLAFPALKKSLCSLEKCLEKFLETEFNKSDFCTKEKTGDSIHRLKNLGIVSDLLPKTLEKMFGVEKDTFLYHFFSRSSLPKGLSLPAGWSSPITPKTESQTVVMKQEAVLLAEQGQQYNKAKDLSRAKACWMEAISLFMKVKKKEKENKTIKTVVLSLVEKVEKINVEMGVGKEKKKEPEKRKVDPAPPKEEEKPKKKEYEEMTEAEIDRRLKLCAPNRFTTMDFVKKGYRVEDRAKKLLERKNLEKCKDTFVEAIQFFMKGLKYEKKNLLKNRLIRIKIERMMTKVEKIKNFLTKEKSLKNLEVMKLQQKIDESLNDCIIEKCEQDWDSILGYDDLKGFLKNCAVEIKFPQTSNKEECNHNILFFGPSKCGKAFMSKCLAQNSDSVLFCIDKWVDDVKFIESLLVQMKTFTTDGKHVILFVRLDNIKNKDVESEFCKIPLKCASGGLVSLIGSTRSPWNLSPQLIGMFPKERQLYVGPPDEPCRKLMFLDSIGDTPHALTDQQWNDLAEITFGYTRKDIEGITKLAVLEPLRVCQKAIVYRKVKGVDPRDPTKIRDDLWTPTVEGDLDGKKMSLLEIDPDDLLPPQVSFVGFVNVVKKEVKPSVSKEDHQKYLEFK